MSTQRPNIVFVLTDDQGYGDLGCHGNPVIRTPNLDRFHSESFRFTDYHVGPTCAPTRAGLFTGHYANSTGVWHTIGGRSLLRREEWTLASALAENGYRTGLFGKWHLGDACPYRPQDRGFEKVVTHGGGGISQVWDYWGNDYFDDTYLEDGRPVQFEGYCTDVWFDQALKFIEHNKEAPFFCCITPNAPHWPYNVPDRYKELYRNADLPEDRRAFYGMITNIDENFARLRRKLCDLKIEDNTILIFMTDNGTSCGATFDDDQFLIEGYNAQMRGMKNSEYDGGHRTPFFLHWPDAGFKNGRDIDPVTANVDLMPTLLDLCGCEIPAGRTFHGVSLKPLLEKKQIADRAVVTDSQRLTVPVKWRKSAVLRDQWRLINGTELYDIRIDPGQKNDIAAEHADIVSRLRQDYEQWWEIVSEKFDQEIPIEIGNPAEPEILLTCHDWQNEDCSCPWHQGHIRQAMTANGYWELDIQKAGRYRFELRRWSRETDLPICAGIDGDDIIWNKQQILPDCWWLYTDGKPIQITSASIEISGERTETAVDCDAHFVEFSLDVPQGPAHLKTQFANDDGLDLGAYYIYIRPEESA